MEKAPPFLFVYTYTKLEVRSDTMPTWYHWQHTTCLLGVATLFLMKFCWLLKSRLYSPKKTLSTVCDGNYSGLGISVPFINHAHRRGMFHRSMYQSIVQFKSLSSNRTRREFVLHQRNVGPLFPSLYLELAGNATCGPHLKTTSSESSRERRDPVFSQALQTILTHCCT